jgi:hypothetical protein
MTYPKYQLTFVGPGVPNGRLTVNGSHTFQLRSAGAGFQVALTTGAEGDAIPQLTITFDEQPAAGATKK